MVGGCFGGRIRRGWLVGRLLGEDAAVEGQVAEHFIGRNVVEAEVLARRPFQRAPMAKRGVEQFEGAGDVGFDEDAGAVDRAVDMAFGGKVHDRIDPFLGQQCRDRVLVGDVGLDEAVIGGVGNRRERGEIARIGQAVEIDDMVALGDQSPHHGAADKARTAGHEDMALGQNPVSRSASKGAARSLSEIW